MYSQLTGGGFTGQGSEGSVNYNFRNIHIYCHFFVCFYDYYESIEKTKEELKSIKLTDLNGENVIDCSVEVLALAERLDSVGAFEPNLLYNIVKFFETTMDRRFEMWDLQKYYGNSDYVQKIRVSDPDRIKEKITNEKLI